MAKKFKGTINIDVRDSKPDWEPFTAPQAPANAPNVLIILYDDTGLAAWSPFGGRIEMPTLQKLADGGLMYSQWHTTALCSPTRSCFLTGRNHHENGFACISEGAIGYPGHNGHIPFENAYLAEVMREKGWNTFWVGKNHNVPSDEWDMGSSKRNWPLARGYDRFYGFLGGETNQWYPDLVEDNHYVDQPYQPEQGYHLSKDLADKALSFIRDSRQSAPTKPWSMFFCPGANHAPHHAPKEWVEKYRGKFDDGYEAYRAWVLPRMIEKGIMPPGTQVTPMNPMPEGTFTPGDAVRPWSELSDDERRLFARMAEVNAAFSDYTDHQVGRIIDYLEESGQLDNTLVLYCADNGASGEGSPNGSVKEGKLFNGWPDLMEDNLPLMEVLGGPQANNHFPTGWAFAFSTPFRMFKRYSYQGGVADPLVIHWPARIKARGEVRSQYHHVTDIVPTILECCGIEFPDFVNGYEQRPLPGVSMRYSFDEATAPTQKVTQYYEMMGTRGIWHDGWKAVAVHGPMTGRGNYDKDQWQLFHTEADRAEAHDLAGENPDKLTQLVNLWYSEAGRFAVLPLDDRSALEFLMDERPVYVPPSRMYTYYPDTLEVPERSAANTHGRSYKILAAVEVTDPRAEGVIIAQGSRFGGHSVFMKEGRLYYVYNFLGIPPEQQLMSDPISPGHYILGVEFSKESVGQYQESHGKALLYVGDRVADEKPLKTMTGHFTLCGEGLCVGHDGGDAVSSQYEGQFPFTGGKISKVEVSIGDDQYVDLEKQAAAMMARE